MKKLGVIAHDSDAEQAKDFDKFLAATMQPCHFAMLQDIFPVATHPTDADLLQIASDVGDANA